jgi:hypothetical protein
MKGGQIGKAALAALLLAGVAVSARAEGPPTQNPNAFLPSSAEPHKSLQLDANGRWTLRLDMDPQVGDQVGGLKDMSAGAFFHISPSMRIGGSVGRQADPQRILPTDLSGPRVHLETKFKF